MKLRPYIAILMTLAVAALTTLPTLGATPKKKQPVVAPSYAWIAMPPLGLHEPATIDTSYIDYSRQSIPSEVSDAYATTGNLGAPGNNMIFFERPMISDFFFRDALHAWLPNNDSQKFYNTRIPMSLVSYNTGGSKQDSQDRLTGVLSGNFNPRAQLGAFVDFIYSLGSYNYQAAKDLSWGLSGSYMGDRYEFQGYYNHYNFLNKENGGITNDLYITDPAQVQGGTSTIDPKAIPTYLTDAHSRVVGTQLMLNHRYKVGYYHEEEVNDTTVQRTYVPVTSFILTTRFDNNRHIFVNGTPGEAAEFWRNTYLDQYGTYDRTTYSAFTNTLGISLLEGFHKYAKFGLGAYATYQIRKYGQTLDTISGLNHPVPGLNPFPAGVAIPKNVTQNLLWVGGQLTKQRGSILTYGATAEFGITEPIVGDVKIDGHLSTRIPMFKDSVEVTAYGRFSNLAPPYLLNNYVSNHFIWQNNFGKERRLRLGGRLRIPQTRTTVEGGVENIQNYLYFDDQCLPAQHTDIVQVFSLTANQGFSYRAFNLEGRVTLQTSTHEGVIPLPKFAIYGNMYFLFTVAKVLKVQAGIDCDYYTRFKGLDYQPATMTFHTQSDKLVGGFPFMNLYANMRLSRTSFYLLYSHFNQDFFDSSKYGYFSVPRYPVNPAHFQVGLLVDFSN